MSLVPPGNGATARRRIGTASAALPCWISEKPSAFRLTPSPEEEGCEETGVTWLSASGAAAEVAGAAPLEDGSEPPLLFAAPASLLRFASFFGVGPPPEPPPTSANPAAARPARMTSVTASTAPVRERAVRAGGGGGRNGSRRGTGAGAGIGRGSPG